MNNFPKQLCLLLLFLFTFQMFGQENDEPWVHLIDYMKVEPGNEKDYVALEKVWQKIHQYNVDRGAVDEWQLLSVTFSANSDYDFVTRTSFSNEAKLGDYMTAGPFPEDLNELLTEEEMKIFDKTSALRKMVRSEVWESRGAIFDTKLEDRDFQVYNYFKLEKGKNRLDHLAVEEQYWKPLHKKAIEKDLLEGWVFASQIFPYGAELPHNNVTVDIYKDMGQYITRDYDELFEEVYPDTDGSQIMKDTRAVAKLLYSEGRKVVLGAYRQTDVSENSID